MGSTSGIRRSFALGQAEHPLPDDVPQDLAGSAADGHAEGVHECAGPLAAIRRSGVIDAEHGVGAEHLAGELGEALVPLGGDQLVHQRQRQRSVL